MENNNLLKDQLLENEEIEMAKSFSKKMFFKNIILANLPYIIFWVLFDILSLYIMFKEAITAKYWFNVIPTIGFNIIIIWYVILKMLKGINENKNIAYVLTNFAFYKINNGKTYKNVEKILITDIVVAEKSEYICDGYYVASNTNNIKILYTNNDQELFLALAEKIKDN